MTTTTTTDAMTELMRLVERQHQQLKDLESRLDADHRELAALKQQLADECQRRRVLSNRVDAQERGTET
jgi:cell division FtsZ-interacting protein ZapD